MRTLQNFLIVAAMGAATAALLSACSSSDNTSSGGTAGATGTAGAPSTAGATGSAGALGSAGASAGTAGAGSTDIPGNASTGATLYMGAMTGCYVCHGNDAEGGIGPNISGSAAGIGMWTQAQFFNAVRNATARSGAPLCSTMQKFPANVISDQGIYDIYAFVKSKMVATPAAAPSCNTP